MEITFRNLKKYDAKRLATLADNKNIWKNVRDYFPNPYTLEDAYQFIEMTNTSTENHVFAICNDEGFVGVTGIHPFKDIYRFKAEIGYWIGEPYWGQGIATESVKWITKYAWKNTEIERLEAGVFGFNKASMRVLEKCGYVKEVIKQKGLYKNGGFHDEHSYICLRPR